MGCTVLNVFGLPWPQGTEIGVMWASAIVLVLGLITAIVGLGIPHLRSVSVVLWWQWLLVAPTAWIVFFISVYGDPGPNTCR